MSYSFFVTLIFFLFSWYHNYFYFNIAALFFQYFVLVDENCKYCNVSLVWPQYDIGLRSQGALVFSTSVTVPKLPFLS